MLENKKLFLLDIDGTICKGNQLIEGAAAFLKDIKICGYHAGVETVLVLSGEATEEEAKACEHQPDYVMSSVAKLHEEWIKSIS